MIVAVDAQLTVGTATGIGEYVRGLIGALRACGDEVHALSEPRLDPWRFDRRVLWDQVVLPARARRSGAPLLHCASGTMPLLQTVPCVVTVHDVAWLKVQAHARVYARWYFGAFALARYRQARAIAVDSAFSRSELHAVLDVDPARVRVVYPGVADDFCRLKRGPGDGATILVPGTVERRKNLEVVIRAAAAIPHARVISVGPPTPYMQECLTLARELGVLERVEIRGYVARPALLDLYARCALVAVPSRYEGFGYAAAQALCAGVPAVLSNRGSLREIAGEDTRLADPDDVEAWTVALRETLEDGRASERAAAARPQAIARFSWSASVAAMRALYAAALQ